MNYDDLKAKVFGNAEEDDLVKRIQAYRRVFRGADGEFVLHHMLSDLQFFNYSVTTEDQVALRNYASRLLFNLGILQQEGEVTRQLLSVLPKS